MSDAIELIQAVGPFALGLVSLLVVLARSGRPRVSVHVHAEAPVYVGGEQIYEGDFE
jgi:hypothetical protein